MAKKPQKPLTAAQRRQKKRRKAEFMIVFINGRQKRVRRPPTIEGLPVDEFIRRNAIPSGSTNTATGSSSRPEIPPCNRPQSPAAVSHR